ncbi:MAG: prepilin-type N-terminal cleavage/methylation domain-containing protein [Candidatus Riflebacteria bacterium]|nr:prepilin-type N-terminal cleavage/methylation domain-containing protein [Candidatus Riflebacteria bacterium]
MKRTKKAFTLIEIIVVSAISAVFITTVVMLLINFRKGYSKSEYSGILMQESALLIARIRTDLNNAVDKQIYSSENQLVFNAYNNTKGIVEPIVYSLEKTSQGHIITRKEGNEKARTIVKNNVASLTWQTKLDVYDTKPIPVKRLSIDFDILLEAPNVAEKNFRLKTSIFPARLNKQIN